MKTVYLYDGTPFLAKLNNEGEYDYPKEAWTETPPPEGIYEPYYYNGNEWIGVTREEWLENRPPQAPYIPSDEEKILAQTQLELFSTQLEVKNLTQDNANMMTEIFKLKEGINNELS
ncbi:hypothetical protein BUZ05_05715 [Staphylococcus gallinarum]|uniref:hypothetical protein n=2 Tax=Staphylococcus gallinarum TaxID=1293 RepID=UPI000D1EBAE5|nr:hypothetical protein [Staphylococcus gallinarum]PTK94114.1 hypothetical protein BUZ05_05715 [Staphylococcus gallinarum]